MSYIQGSQGYKQYDIPMIIAKKNRVFYGKNLIQNQIFHNIFNASLQLAHAHCQNTFKWDQWNCPEEDFHSKRISQNILLDRETAFVSAITTASLIFTIIKNCTEGNLLKCSDACNKSDKNQFGICDNNIKFAETLTDQLTNEEIANDAHGYAILHNNRAAKLAIKNSLKKYCGFIDYDNKPKNVLAYVHESLNYCKPNIITNWKGMIGRQCSRTKNKESSLEERRSCRNLCRACGLKGFQGKF
ncbi:wnt inhibitor of Dorsal protein [Condylostylus longicornis]|uniref:wnt inhibitor of Dorsal protein n=1 Tax=Condylostylus longicornis TaxID=2530218 RepID=UPI00244E3E1C|nr:wnt inhibitor of Dorsal protein [Condylostylus longicornis]